MAIVSVRALFPGRGGKDNQKRRRTFTIVYEVVSDDQYEGEAAIANAVDPDTDVTVPVLWDSHPVVTDAVVTEIDVDQSDESFYIWYVSVKYDSEPENAAGNEPDTVGSGESPGAAAPNPVDRPTTFKVTSIDREEVVREWRPVNQSGVVVQTEPDAWATGVTYGYNKFVKINNMVYRCTTPGVSGVVGPFGVGTGIPDGTASWDFWSSLAQALNDPASAIIFAALNSGKVPFNPTEKVSVSIPCVVVSMFMPPDALSLLYAMRVKNAVNVVAWRKVPARCAKIINFTMSQALRQNGFDYIEAEWTVGLDPDTWDTRIMDSGFGTIVTRTVDNPAAPPATIQKKFFERFKDSHGDSIDEAVPMDGKGGKLDPDANPVFLRGVPRQVQLIDFNTEIPFR